MKRFLRWLVELAIAILGFIAMAWVMHQLFMAYLFYVLEKQ